MTLWKRGWTRTKPSSLDSPAAGPIPSELGTFSRRGSCLKASAVASRLRPPTPFNYADAGRSASLWSRIMSESVALEAAQTLCGSAPPSRASVIASRRSIRA